MARFKLDKKALHAKVAQATEGIVVGAEYFLSSFHDKEGARVKVLAKSTAKNSCGWNSTVTVEVLEALDPTYNYYKVGAVHTVNATNLYVKREHASPAYKYANL